MRDRACVRVHNGETAGHASVSPAAEYLVERDAESVDIRLLNRETSYQKRSVYAVGWAWQEWNVVSSGSANSRRQPLLTIVFERLLVSKRFGKF